MPHESEPARTDRQGDSQAASASASEHTKNQSAIYTSARQNEPSPKLNRSGCWRRIRVDWRRSKLHDKIVAIAALIAVAIAGGQLVVYVQMKRIMNSSSGQTDQLIKAAKIQACSAQKIADASNRNAAAAESFSAGAGGIKKPAFRLSNSSLSPARLSKLPTRRKMRCIFRKELILQMAQYPSIPESRVCPFR